MPDTSDVDQKAAMAALLSLTKHNIPPDVQELLIYGNPDRNLPDGEIKARGRDGRMKGNDIRLSYPANVLKAGSLLDPQDAMRALREAHTHFVENGKIES